MLFRSSVLLVSHDRAFLREVATRVWFFDGTRLVDFDGPFIEWETWRKDKAAQSARAEADAQERKRAAEKEKAKKRAANQEDDHAAKRAHKRAVEDAEAAANHWEQRVAELEAQLADTDLYDGSAEAAQKAARLDQELAKARKALDEALAAWAEAAETR